MDQNVTKSSHIAPAYTAGAHAPKPPAMSATFTTFLYSQYGVSAGWTHARLSSCWVLLQQRPTRRFAQTGMRPIWLREKREMSIAKMMNQKLMFACAMTEASSMPLMSPFAAVAERISIIPSVVMFTVRNHTNSTSEHHTKFARCQCERDQYRATPFICGTMSANVPRSRRGRPPHPLRGGT